jgi:hypothetical protein
MKPQDDKLQWKYLDGEATEQERTGVQHRLADDAAFKAELQSRQQLHHTLQQIEPEQPSMRFVMNVMESLPQLYKKAIEPLVSPKWVKVFLGSLGVFIIGLFGYVATTIGSFSMDSTLGEKVIAQLNALPASLFTALAMISFTYLFFVILDRQLKKRFVKK